MKSKIEPVSGIYEEASITKGVILSLIVALALFVIFGVRYASGFFNLEPKIIKSVDLNPQESVFVIFNRQMISTFENVQVDVSPKTSFEVLWFKAGRGIEIRPIQYWVPGTTYKIKLQPKNGLPLQISPEHELQFKISDFPRVVSVSPEEEASGFMKKDSAIVVKFNKSTIGWDVSFEISPYQTFDYSYDKERKEFKITARDGFRYSTEYEIKISTNFPKVKELKNTSYQGKIKTEIDPKIVREQQAKMELEAKVAAAHDEVMATLASHEKERFGGKYIDINLTYQTLSIYENEKNKGTFKVSTGKRGMATPTGHFSILAKRGRAYSRKYGLYMPYFMQFTYSGHGIHELPEWPNGYKEGANHLGIPVSHGCVRLGVGPARTVYNFVDVGTPVIIHY